VSKYSDDDLFVTMVSLPIIAVMLAVIIFGVRQVKHHIEVSTCEQFSIQSGHQTKFADYNFFSFECLVKADNNKWVPLKGLREMNA
jgi:hypothetical protein